MSVVELVQVVLAYFYMLILLAPSVQALQSLVNICESELSSLDMSVNTKKSACVRFGTRYRTACKTLSLQMVTSLSGQNQRDTWEFV